MYHATRLLLFLICLCAFSSVHAQKIDARLTQKLTDAMSGFHGETGIYVHHLKTGKTVAINADTTFPTASTIKIPIMIGLFDQIEKGTINYQ
ncbi:MAG: serine hydrolase, partial [Cytophagaceae bacterium]